MTDTNTSMFEQIGGEVTIDRLVERFYDLIDSLPQARTIRDMHEADLGPLKRVLKRYLTEWLGGPALYSSERGHPRLRQRHMGFPIDNAARDAWMECMDLALAETVPDEAARQNIHTALAKLADWMRNRQDETG
ncbi:group II truncated hemoglobin [Novosphingobium mangrovi (ex Huang et al. 2023)]|uniref:Group II truncated hemoglobin n=1 Tax=Novosphingobium mangrovi (ex Huang et al. 2023) TaxID=2976432 RepID=A0ABT2I269_9SPHN|nr:group II truncated hemoglobin [Novosphingobium mangrovi (ex Huang et al. 2023)]MCT2398900.1 group II truncated hemoglobin [Novosphingobium mangrovi (ex Huang et al. 2023)]